MTAVDIIGYFATFMITICYIPQLIHIYKTKEVAAISLGMYCALSLGVGAWLIYSFMVNLLPMIICNGLSLGMILTILVMKVVYSKQPVSEMLHEEAEAINKDIDNAAA